MFRFSRERLRRVLFFVKSICRTTSHLHLHIVTSAHLHSHIFTSVHLHLCSSSHLRIYISAHLHIFTSAHLHVCTSTSSHLHICASHICGSSRPSFLSLLRRGRRRRQSATKRNPLRRRSCVSRTRNAGEFLFLPCPAQPSARSQLLGIV